MRKSPDARKSDSPVLFASISESYLKAFDPIWMAGFSHKDPFCWDTSLILHPISQLLGIALETAVKGLLACREPDPPRIHDLEQLLNKIDDKELLECFAASMADLIGPEAIYEANPNIDRANVDAKYRSHWLHVKSLNLVYNKPYATRYPDLGGRSTPNPLAARKIIVIVQERLKKEKRNWTPRK